MNVNLYTFEKTIYKGNLSMDLYFFLLKKKIGIIKYFFKNLFNLFLYLINIKYKKRYYDCKFEYFKEFKNLKFLLKEFSETKKKNISKWYLKNYSEKDIIITNYPKILIENFVNSKKVYGKKVDKNYKIIGDNLKKFKCKNVYINSKKFIKYILSGENIYIAKNNKFRYLNLKEKKISNKNNLFFHYLGILALLILLSLLLTIISLTFSTAIFDETIFSSYFDSFLLILLNFLPIFLIMLLVYIITNRLWIGYLISSIIFIGISIINKIKLICRDDPFMFEDITLWKEALMMGGRYDYSLSFKRIILILGILFIVFLSYRFIKKSHFNKKFKLCTLFIFVLISIPLYKNVYLNDKIYNDLGNKDIINVWISTRQYQIRGVIYPFIHSSKNNSLAEPDDYNEKDMELILSKYEKEKISEDKKVNIISIMLEAYSDFSVYDEIEFTEDIYKPFHDIQKESYTGTLSTTIFGAGTIVTERNFLTGYYTLPNFRKKNNTFIQYLKEEGYYTEAMHPIYGAFYNRNTANANIGFYTYLNYENTFKELYPPFANDEEFFSNIIKRYEENIKNNVPYFNFSVTYQNHGPYTDQYYPDKPYFIKNNDYSESSYNLINQYFKGIKSTNIALQKLVEYFKTKKEPVVLLFFGDHKPFWGEGNIPYKELGINLDLTTIEGYENYYETPFVIWSNKSAKEIISKNFDESSNKISPQFLMSELFEYIGIKGNEYMQYSQAIKQKCPVLNNTYCYNGEEYITVSKETQKKIKNEFINMNYYMINKK